MKATIDGLSEAIAAMENLAGDKPAAALADALNHTANQARIALRAEISSVFDRPTPWALNALRVEHAKPKSLESAVFAKDDKDGDTRIAGQHGVDDWVKAQVDGGSRPLKNSEHALRNRGILPAGYYIAPGKGARLDKYGNMSRGHMKQLLSGLLAAELYSGYTANASRSKRSQKKGHEQAFFVMRDKAGKAFGIGERRGKSLAVVLAFVSQPQYTQRLDFYAVVDQVADDNLEKNIDLAVTKLLEV